MPARTDRRIKITVLRGLARIRLDDAWTLFETEKHERRSGAIYMAGFSVECAIKAAICRKAGKRFFDPDSEAGKYKIHGLRLLIERGGLWNILRDNEGIRFTLLFLDEWTVAWRYNQAAPKPEWTEQFLDRAEDFNQWLSEKF